METNTKAKLSRFDSILIGLNRIFTGLFSSQTVVIPLQMVDAALDGSDLEERLQFLTMINSLYLLKTSGGDLSESKLKDLNYNEPIIEQLVEDMELLRHNMRQRTDGDF